MHAMHNPAPYVPPQYLSLVSVMISIVLACHWTACVWGLQASFNPLGSWLGTTGYCEAWDAAPDGTWPECPPGFDCVEPSCGAGASDCSGGYACRSGTEQYIYSLYWSIMTITSVGFGDVSATKFNQSEQIVCSVIMLLSGML